MLEPSLEDLRARVARLELDVAAIRTTIDKADDDLTEWRHKILGEKLSMMNDEIYRVRSAFDKFMAEKNAWAWLPKLVMVAAATIVAGFVAWLAWQLLHLWAAVPVRP